MASFYDVIAERQVSYQVIIFPGKSKIQKLISLSVFIIGSKAIYNQNLQDYNHMKPPLS